MTKIEKVLIGIIALLTIGAFVFWKDIRTMTGTDAVMVKSDGDKKKDKKNKKDKEENEQTKTIASPGITISQKWDMPSDLKEISGLAFISENQFACIQDELGKIFIFNTTTEKVEKEIQFAGAGDYEGIAIVNSDAYVARADGKLFEVRNYNATPSVVEHSTHLTAKQNVEGVSYDKKNNRLLLSIKGKEPNNDNYKGIYAFDLASKKLAVSPAYKIDLTHNIWAEVKGKNKIQPSGVEVHPINGDIYIIDGPGPSLLVMGADGAKKKLYQLNSSEFAQPEGIAFTQTGELFISNEGRTGVGNILKVSVDSKL